MVSTVTTPTDPRNRAAAGQGFDGVVRISVGGLSGTGVLTLTAVRTILNDDWGQLLA